MKQLVIEFEGDWVLSHRDDDELPVAVLKSILSDVKGVEIKSFTHTALVLNCDEQQTTYREIEEFILQLLDKKYPREKIKDNVFFRLDDVAVEAKKGEKADQKTTPSPEVQQEEIEQLIEELEDLLGDDVDDEKSDNASATREQSGVILDQIDELVGAAEFKALAKEIVGIADGIKRTETYEVFTNRCYLFSIGDGCGLTTYLELFAKLISDCGLCKMAARPVREVALGAYKESMEPFAEACDAIKSTSVNNVRIICVDVSEWMDKTDNRYFKQFLRTAEKHGEEHILVFKVPFVDKDILSRIRHSLSDLVSIKTVSIPPMSKSEMQTYAEAELKRLHFKMTKSAWKYFFERISEEKSDGKFYGVNTVKKVVRELIYQKHLSNAQKKESSQQITANDAKTLCDYVGDGTLSGAEQLNKLVGVEGIKKHVEEIIAQIELAVKSSAERPCIHMRFVGNPGTGKTTVARIIGKLLKEKGILRVGAFFEYAGRDFCGRYIGETAPKTSSICRDAYGSVLFIDEAYSLYRGDGDTKDFGREAIDTLIAEMENHRDDFIVIMAGYTDDMDKLMSGNYGLKSRMPYTIEFPNFTREQLYDIYVSMAKGNFKCDPGLFDSARNFFMNLSEDFITAKEFPNARYVRNLFERTWAKAAMRCQLNGKADVVLTRDDFEHASADKEFAANVPKKTRLGF